MEAMVKGIYKHVVYVRDMDSDIFEQAIFILKPHAMEHRSGREGVLGEAQKVLEEYALRQGLGDVGTAGSHGLMVRTRNRLMYWALAAAAVGTAIGAAIFFL